MPEFVEGTVGLQLYVYLEYVQYNEHCIRLLAKFLCYDS